MRGADGHREVWGVCGVLLLDVPGPQDHAGGI